MQFVGCIANWERRSDGHDGRVKKKKKRQSSDIHATFSKPCRTSSVLIVLLFPVYFYHLRSIFVLCDVSCELMSELVALHISSNTLHFSSMSVSSHASAEQMQQFFAIEVCE